MQVCFSGAYFKTPNEKLSSPYLFVLGYRSAKLQLDFRTNDLGIVFKDKDFKPLDSSFSITAVGPSHTVEVICWFFHCIPFKINLLTWAFTYLRNMAYSVIYRMKWLTHSNITSFSCCLCAWLYSDVGAHLCYVDLQLKAFAPYHTFSHTVLAPVSKVDWEPACRESYVATAEIKVYEHLAWGIPGTENLVETQKFEFVALEFGEDLLSGAS